MASNAIVGILRALLTIDTAQFESGTKKASDSMRVLSRDLGKMGQLATTVGRTWSVAVTAPIVAFGAAAAKSAIDFESSFAGVRKTVEATEAEFKVMSDSLRELATTIPVNVNELNRLAEAAGALGIPKAEIVDFARVMAQLGVTTNLTSDQAAESIAKIQTVFQAAGKETQNFASALVHLGNNGASTEAEILALAQRIASAGKNIGLTQASVLGFASAIANVGIEAEAGGSAISKVFADISIAVSEGGTALQAFADVAKMSATDFAKLFKADAETAIKAFIEGLGRMKDEGKDLNIVLRDLGFEEIRQARALRDLALSGNNLSESLKTANTGWRENTALTEEARKRFETTKSQLVLLGNRLRDVAITIGNALKPTIDLLIVGFNRLMPILTSAGEFFAALPLPIQVAGIALVALVAAAGPAIFVFGQLLISASAITAAFTRKGIATRALTALMPGLTAVTTAQAAADTAGAAAANTAAVATTRLGAMMRGTTAAFAAAPMAVGLFTAALAGIVVPFALIKVTELIEQLRGLMADSTGWKVSALGNQATHLRAMAEASKIAGREVQTLAEAMEILNVHNAKLRQTQASGGAFKLSADQAAQVRASLTGTTEQIEKVKTLAEQYDALRAKVALLTPEQKANIDAGKKMGLSAEDINKHVKVGVDVIEAYTGSLKHAKDAVKDLHDELTGLQDIADAETMLKSLQGLDIRSLATEQQGRINKTMKDAIAAYERLSKQVPSAIRAAFNASATSQIQITDEILQQINREQVRGEAPSLPNLIGDPDFVQSWKDYNKFQTSALVTGKELEQLAEDHWQQLNKFANPILDADKATRRWDDSLGTVFQSVQQLGAAFVALGDASIGMRGMKGFQEGGASGAAAFYASLLEGGSALAAATAHGSTGARAASGAATGAKIGGGFVPGAGHLFGAGIGALIGWARGSAAEASLKHVLRAEALKLAEVFDHVASAEDKAKVGADRLAKSSMLVKQVYADTGQSVERASRILQTLFDDPAASAEDMAEALQEVNDLLDRQSQLTDARRKRQEMLNEAVERYGFTFEEAGRIFQRQSLAEQAERLIEDFRLLTESGADASVIAMRMAEATNAFLKQANETGTEVPEGLRPLIDAMLDAGVLLDSAGRVVSNIHDSEITFGSELEVMFENVLVKLDELITLLMEPLKEPTGLKVGRSPIPERDGAGEVRTGEGGLPIGRGPASRHIGGVITAHTGKVLGLGSGEVLVKALSGESVLSRFATSMLGGRATIDALNANPMAGMSAALDSLSFNPADMPGGVLQGTGSAGLRMSDGEGGGVSLTVLPGGITVSGVTDPERAADLVILKLPRAISQNRGGLRTTLRKQLPGRR